MNRWSRIPTAWRVTLALSILVGGAASIAIHGAHLWNALLLSLGFHLAVEEAGFSERVVERFGLHRVRRAGQVSCVVAIILTLAFGKVRSDALFFAVCVAIFCAHTCWVVVVDKR